MDNFLGAEAASSSGRLGLWYKMTISCSDIDIGGRVWLRGPVLRWSDLQRNPIDKLRIIYRDTRFIGALSPVGDTASDELLRSPPRMWPDMELQHSACVRVSGDTGNSGDRIHAHEAVAPAEAGWKEISAPVQ